MTPSACRSRPRRTVVHALGALALLLVGASVIPPLTAAAFSDHASIRLNGDEGIGGRFDIAGITEDGSTIVDAPTSDEAMLLPFSPADTRFTTSLPLGYRATVVNGTDSVPGNIVVQVNDPDPETGDLFGYLRFSVAVDGETVAAGVSADEFNALKISLGEVAPGGKHEVSIEAILDPATPRAMNGRQTSLGLMFRGASS